MRGEKLALSVVGLAGAGAKAAGWGAVATACELALKAADVGRAVGDIPVDPVRGAVTRVNAAIAAHLRDTRAAGGGRGGVDETDAILDALDRVLPGCVPSVRALVVADMDFPAIQKTLQAGLARAEPAFFAPDRRGAQVLAQLLSSAFDRAGAGHRVCRGDAGSGGGADAAAADRLEGTARRSSRSPSMACRSSLSPCWSGRAPAQRRGSRAGTPRHHRPRPPPEAGGGAELRPGADRTRTRGGHRLCADHPRPARLERGRLHPRRAGPRRRGHQPRRIRPGRPRGGRRAGGPRPPRGRAAGPHPARPGHAAGDRHRTGHAAPRRPGGRAADRGAGRRRGRRRPPCLVRGVPEALGPVV